MKKLILLLLAITTLSACSYIHPYRPTIRQGNMVDPARVSQLKVGMSAAQVADVMGTPVLENSFNDNQVTYVYMLIPNNGPVTYRRATVFLKNGRVVKIDKVTIANYRVK